MVLSLAQHQLMRGVIVEGLILSQPRYGYLFDINVTFLWVEKCYVDRRGSVKEVVKREVETAAIAGMKSLLMVIEEMTQLYLLEWGID